MIPAQHLLLGDNNGQITSKSARLETRPLPSPPLSRFCFSPQDLRLYTVTSIEDATVCNNEKLASGSTAAYVRSAELFLKETIFGKRPRWPTVVWAPSNMIDSDDAPNLQISVSEVLLWARQDVVEVQVQVFIVTLFKQSMCARAVCRVTFFRLVAFINLTLGQLSAGGKNYSLFVVLLRRSLLLRSIL